MYPPALLTEETARIQSLGWDPEAYIRCSRSGSAFRLSRADRKAIFDQVATEHAQTEQGRRELADTCGAGLSPAYLAAWIAGPATSSPACPKCGGSGRIPEFRHVAGGECFACGGTGKEVVNAGR